MATITTKRKKLFIGFGVVVAVILAFGWSIFLAPGYKIRKLDRGYQQVQRGMTTNEVMNVMGRGGVWRAAGFGPYWDEAPLSSAESVRARMAVRYSVRTFFLPVIFEITFDESGKVVGKHRY